MPTTDVNADAKKPVEREAAREVTIANRQGIHARPAALVVKTASAFRSEVTLEKEGQRVSAKSIMGVLTIEGYFGARVRVAARGPDAEQAVAAVCELFERKFYED